MEMKYQKKTFKVFKILRTQKALKFFVFLIVYGFNINIFIANHIKLRDMLVAKVTRMFIIIAIIIIINIR